jgi:hypothetical protein
MEKERGLYFWRRQFFYLQPLNRRVKFQAGVVLHIIKLYDLF